MSATYDILVVDNNPDNLWLLQEILEEQGYHVRVAKNGQAALNTIRSRPSDLILLDIMMPGMDGYDVCNRLKADARTSEIPIIFISALLGVLEKVKAFELGGVDYITKPFQAKEVIARVENHLAIRELQKQLHEQNACLEQEIAERNQAEEALYTSRQLLEKVFVSLEEAVFVVDPFTHTIMLSNPAVERIFGYKEQEVFGKSMECLYPDQPQYLHFERDIAHVLDAGEVFYAEFQMRRKDSSMFISDHKVMTTTDQRGHTKRIIHIVRDVTERKLSEDALQLHNRELSSLNRLGRIMGSSLELDQVFTTALQEVQQLLNVVSVSFWLTIPETDILECLHASGPRHEQLIKRQLKQGQGVTGWVAQHGESSIIADIQTDPRYVEEFNELSSANMRSMLSVPLWAKGHVIGVLNVADTRQNHFTAQDVQFTELIASTAARAIENARLYAKAQQEIAERKQAEKALRKANESKDKFFSIISHDLRSPFTSLLGNTEMLVAYFDDFNQDRLKIEIQKLHQTSGVLYNLLENLLTWSRLQRGAMTCNPTMLSLQKAAEGTIELFWLKAEQKQVSLKHCIQDDAFVYADYNMLTTIIRNLVSNAMKFTNNGDSIEISVEQQQHDIEVTVSDTGIGIPREDIPKLFRTDTNPTRTGTGGEKGTGLGLILCQELVAQNGGKIWVESRQNEETRFTFTLPTSPEKQGGR